jgi:pilus biogenesis lipoprotein CpaD
MKTKSNRLFNRACSIAALVLVPAMLVACEHRPLDYATWKQNEPTVQPRYQTMQSQHVVNFAPKSTQLSEVEREAIGIFLRQNGVQTGSQVFIGAPAKTAAQNASAKARLNAVLIALRSQGINARTASVKSTDNQHTGDEVVVFAQTVALVVPECPGYNQPITLDYEWRPESPVGCANAVNFARMVANPNDIAQGRVLAPGDGANNVMAIQRYRGEDATPQTFPNDEGADSVPFRMQSTSQ